MVSIIVWVHIVISIAIRPLFPIYFKEIAIVGVTSEVCVNSSLRIVVRVYARLPVVWIIGSDVEWRRVHLISDPLSEIGLSKCSLVHRVVSVVEVDVFSVVIPFRIIVAFF